MSAHYLHKGAEYGYEQLTGLSGCNTGRKRKYEDN